MILGKKDKQYLTYGLKFWKYLAGKFGACENVNKKS